MPTIDVQDLSKDFFITMKEPGVGGAVKAIFKPVRETVHAVKNVSFQIEQGELVGFLGPNGAGKTTTLKMLSGVLFPTSGSCSVLGFKPFDRRPEMLRKMSLVMGNKNQLWWDLPAIDSFQVLKELYEVSDESYRKRCGFLVDALNLGDKIQTQVRKMSLGERMKCELVAALLHSPEVIFLDEPTIGLDVVSQKTIREFLRYLNQEERCTLILTSHYMQDVQELCERVIVIDHGSKVFEGTLKSLSEQYSDGRRLKLSFSSPVEADDLARYGTIIESEPTEAVLQVEPSQVAEATSAILQKFPVSDVSIQQVDIEDVIRSLFEQSR